MSQAKSGDTVKVHYRGTLEDGTVFDSSEGRDPLEFDIGSGQLIPGFEAAVDGMAAGETSSISISSTEAYGPHREEMVMEVPRTQLPAEMEPKIGMQLQAGQGDEQFVVTITEVQEETVTLDANHPLAGKDLNFEITLVEIVA
ncbi:MAG: peptidylprolyl isomerase [Gammaproteobacteria bacterium]|nr:peptidylprolyl isomerase [Gammaproteobacteria bacterium]